MICLFISLLPACEKSIDQSSSDHSGQNSLLTFRDGDPCEDCALLDDCCCGIELQDPGQSGNFPIRICGNDDGTTDCTDTPPNPCGAISGGFIPFTLNTANPKVPYCMVPGGYFKIFNPGGSNLVIKLTCHYDIVNPTYTFVTVTPGQTYVYEVEPDCDVEECYHD